MARRKAPTLEVLEQTPEPVDPRDQAEIDRATLRAWWSDRHAALVAGELEGWLAEHPHPRGFKPDPRPGVVPVPGVRVIIPVPEPDDALWPSLGGEMCAFVEDLMVHGPGDVLGESIALEDEERYVVWRCYEVFPQAHNRAGRRRFKRVILSRRKGWAKTALAQWVAIAESHPHAPVRCRGWLPDGRPFGGAVRDPYIPMMAYTKDQVDGLAYAGVRAVLDHKRCALGGEYDTGVADTTLRGHPGKLEGVSTAPDSRDGARTTFDHRDETHRMRSPRHHEAVDTLDENLTKRLAADPWSLATTTMYGPNEGSVAEVDHEWAIDIQEGNVAPEDAALYFDHLQASEDWDLDDDAELRAAIEEAAGDAIGHIDVDAIIATRFRKPGVDLNRSRRYQLNQRRRYGNRWVQVTDVWPDLEHPRLVVPGARVVLALDGSYNRDSTALIGATVERVPHVFVVKVWERPLKQPGWRVPRLEVMHLVHVQMRRLEVVELAPDPPGWHTQVEELEQEYGEDVVVRFETKQTARFGPACSEFAQACQDGELSHDGSEVLDRHLTNAVPTERRGEVIIAKESPDSQDHIDGATGAVVAYARARWHWLHTPAPVAARVRWIA